MPRTSGSLNMKFYKYKVEQKVNDQIIIKYYLSQPGIVEDTGLKRSSVYFLLLHPDKVSLKTRQNYKITKLKDLLPVFHFTKTINNEGNILVEYSKIDY